MRNPLSAIMQSADGILSSLSEMQQISVSPANEGQYSSTLDTMAEMAQTIVFCAQHQNRIVNDILTLSKLDASLLTVTPVPVDPVKTCVSALKLHEQELAKADIQGDIVTDDSYHALAIDRVYLDPSRILQLLINLITNAIKLFVAWSNPICVDVADSIIARGIPTIEESLYGLLHRPKYLATWTRMASTLPV